MTNTFTFSVALEEGQGLSQGAWTSHLLKVWPWASVSSSAKWGVRIGPAHGLTVRKG